MRFTSLTRGVALSGALTLSYASVAAAAASTGGEQTPLRLSAAKSVTHAASGGGSGIMRTIIALVVVCAIIYAVTRILKAVKGRDAVRASGSGLEQLATLPLSQGKSVSLVRSGRDIILLGIGEQGVTPIKTYTEQEAAAAGIELPAGPEIDVDAAERPMDRVVDRLRQLTVRS